MIITESTIDNLGDMLKERRKEKGVSIMRMARESYVSDRAISDIEEGYHTPRLITLVLMAKVLGMEIEIREA